MTRICLAVAVLFPVLTAAQVSPPAPPPPPAPAYRTLEAGVMESERLGPSDFEGVLDDSDLTREDGKPYDSYSFRVEADDQVIVTMTATTFDT